MTRLITDGAEFGDVLFWDYVNATTAVTSPTPISGSYSYCVDGGACNKYIGNQTEIYLRHRIRSTHITPGTSGTNTYPSFYSGGTAVAWLSVDGSGYFYAATPDGTLETSTSASTIGYDNIWYLVEIYYKIDDTVGRFVVKWDGVTIIDFTGDTKYSSYSTFDTFGYTCTSWLGGHSTNYVDDLAINDTNGSEDNTWCGGGHIEVLLPVSDGDTLEWTPSSGSVNYTMVDERPSDGDTTYVSASTPGLIDMYHVSTFSQYGRGPISRIWAEGRARDAEYTGGRIRLGFKTSSGSVIMGDWNTLTGQYNNYAISSASTINPEDGEIWEETDINNIQLVIERE